MKTGLALGAVVAIAAIAFGTYMVDIDQTEEGALPEISVESGTLPEYDADVGKIETGTEEVTLDVPTVDITPPEEDAEEVASN